jgi:hypothetical protein
VAGNQITELFSDEERPAADPHRRQLRSGAQAVDRGAPDAKDPTRVGETHERLDRQRPLRCESLSREELRQIRRRILADYPELVERYGLPL